MFVCFKNLEDFDYSGVLDALQHHDFLDHSASYSVTLQTFLCNSFDCHWEIAKTVGCENDLGVGSSTDLLEKSVKVNRSYWGCPLDFEVAS
jgi:hypothetical protein